MATQANVAQRSHIDARANRQRTGRNRHKNNENADMPSIEQSFAALASRLIDIDPTSRKQAAFQLASLADSPEDHHKLAALFTVTTMPSKRLRA